ncbi:membrane protein insertion efficiency factor YidD [Nitrosospira multiformis]|uniref:membrane protein insertion efficiency factor YidD n=1 Tax=Nitrosospira multiformis TaxID=1231 RepID=UPI000943FF1A|nr:membrane protein insertion efficiency factor YidD [Nitrosospira multiformis]
MSRMIIAFIRLYQYCLSPFLGPSCRFSPSCSHYACEALARHGATRGLVLSVWRIMRCNPWSRGGYDPVPAKPLR